jgi:hypothetical protein
LAVTVDENLKDRFVLVISDSFTETLVRVELANKKYNKVGRKSRDNVVC